MWDRGDLKRKGKNAFMRNYWRCVIVALILSFVIGGMGSSFTYRTQHQPEYAQLQQNDDMNPLEAGVRGLLGVVNAVIAIAMAFAALALKLLIFNPLEVGGDAFFFRNTLGPASLGELKTGFRNSFGRNVVALLFRDVFIALWSMLFVIPGIVKAYSYMLVPYILADSPELSRREAFDLSQKLMYGSKWKAFLLDLSFIGWYILNPFTFGLLGVLYVGPYRYAAKAELYRVLRYSTYV